MKTASAFAVLALLIGCSTEVTESSTQATAEPAAAALVIAKAEVHDAICGHVLKEVGHCGNYVKLGGKYVELQYPSLGKMEYCAAGETGAKIEITGAMADGKFVAATYRRVE